MKIAIPVDEKRIDSPVCISFGRTPYFMFYNTDTKEANYFDNSAFNTQGGAGIKASQMLVDEGVNIVITMHCGQNAAEVLKDNIKIYKSIEGSAQDNINAFLNNELNLLTQIHPGLHNHG